MDNLARTPSAPDQVPKTPLSIAESSARTPGVPNVPVELGSDANVDTIEPSSMEDLGTADSPEASNLDNWDESHDASDYSSSSLSGLAVADFLNNLDNITTTIPDAVTRYFLLKAGQDQADPKVVKVISLAAEKFISDVLISSLQLCKLRGGGQASRKNPKDRRFVLTLEDLTPALAEYGVKVKRPPYYC